MQEYVIKFNEGCFEVLFTSDTIRIRGRVELEIRQRVLTIRGALKNFIYGIRGGRKKVVYVYHVGADAKCNSHKKIVEDISNPLAHIKYTKSHLGGYLTVITSSLFLIDYIVISDDALAVILPGRREIYVDESDNVLVLYIV